MQALEMEHRSELAHVHEKQELKEKMLQQTAKEREEAIEVRVPSDTDPTDI